jgi:hypothetical protein
MTLRVPEFNCGNGKGDVAALHATEAYGEVRLQLVKSYPRNVMRVGDHIHAHGHVSPEGRSPVLSNGRLRGPHSPMFLKLWSADHKWSSGSALVVLLD